jgi:hypothetical protein
VARRRILVVGYPKSGNTWVTRLTADLVDAPVCGFWGRPETPEIAVEGRERAAPIDVYKGHHECDVVTRDFAAANLVYVVRDVRDVALSGAHYFLFRDRSFAGRLAYLARSVRRNFAPRADVDFRLRRMLEVLADGEAGVSEWCARPWDEHVQAYLAADAFVVRYEDLLDDTEGQARRLLRHLGIERTTVQIRAALQRQSFAVARQRYLVAGDIARAKFLRAGRHGDWVSVLTAAQQTFCWNRFGATLALAGYPADGLAPMLYSDEGRVEPPCRRRAG